MVVGSMLASLLAPNSQKKGTPFEYVDQSQCHVAKRIVGDRGQRFGQLRFRRHEGCRWIGHEGKRVLDRVNRRRSNEHVDIVAVGGERAIEKALRLRHIFRARTLIDPS
jgi:hypothetical protein